MELKFNSSQRSSGDCLPTYTSSSNHHSKYDFNMHTRGRGMVVSGLRDSSCKVKGRMDGLGGRAILHENGHILAVIICERKGRHFAYKLLSPNPRYSSQKPYRHRIKDQKFYEHMTIRRTSYFSNNFIIQSFAGDEKYEVRETSGLGPLQLKVYEKESGRCCGAVRQFFEHDDVCSSSWNMLADSDLSPKILICITIIASKSLGKLY